MYGLTVYFPELLTKTLCLPIAFPLASCIQYGVQVGNAVVGIAVGLHMPLAVTQPQDEALSVHVIAAAIHHSPIDN